MFKIKSHFMCFFFLCIFSQLLFADHFLWSDLFINQKLKLNQQFVPEHMIYLKSDFFYLDEINFDSELYFEFNFTHATCNVINISDEMNIYYYKPLDAIQNFVGWGIRKLDDCRIKIIIEPTDFYRESLFQDSTDF